MMAPDKISREDVTEALNAAADSTDADGLTRFVYESEREWVISTARPDGPHHEVTLYTHGVVSTFLTPCPQPHLAVRLHLIAGKMWESKVTPTTIRNYSVKLHF